MPCCALLSSYVGYSLPDLTAVKSLLVFCTVVNRSGSDRPSCSSSSIRASYWGCCSCWAALLLAAQLSKCRPLRTEPQLSAHCSQAVAGFVADAYLQRCQLVWLLMPLPAGAPRFRCRRSGVLSNEKAVLKMWARSLLPLSVSLTAARVTAFSFLCVWERCLFHYYFF